MKALKESGFTTIFLGDIVAYVYEGGELVFKRRKTGLHPLQSGSNM